MPVNQYPKQAKQWGIIGPGKIAAKFAAALAITEGAELAAVASRDEARAGEFAGKFGAPRSYGDYGMLAKDPGVDAVYIATPHGFHCEHALLCLQQGKAVLCEKPMALSNRQVQEMVDASRTHKTFLMEAMWTRFLPMTGKLLALIVEGRIGKVKYVRADFGFAPPFNPDGRLYNKALGGGSLLDIGIYPLFLCQLLLGEPSGIMAAAQLAPTGADDSCVAALHYPDGALAVISSLFSCQTSITAEIAGTEGIIRIPTPWYKNNRLTLSRQGLPDEEFRLEPVVNGFEYQIRETMRCMDNGLIESPDLTHAFSLSMSRVMDAIRKQCGVFYPGE
ncbi:MAG: Gfo/Idh/MocA family oxidoreductase [Puia sp.]|nr:Gfo/Idh/MocA family oxidoreductase [Puia sp.]